MAITDYEIFEHEQVLTLQSLGWKGHALMANFGDGYGAGVLVGNASGLRKWSLSSGLIPDEADQTDDLVSYGASQTDTRYDYLQEFFERHITLGNKPFIIKDINRSGTENQYWLVSFESNEIGYDVLSSVFFGGGSVALVQRRASDLTFNADGSIDGALMATKLSVTVNGPTGLAEGIISHFQIIWDWTAAAVGDYAVAGYETRLDGGAITDVGNVVSSSYSGLVGDTQYTIEVRTYDVQGFRSAWVSDTATTDPEP